MARRSLTSRYLVDTYMNDDDDVDEEYEESLLAQIEEEEERLANKSSRRGHRGSIKGHAIVERDSVEGHERLYCDYFANPPKYGARLFRRRFRMKQTLFSRIHDDVVSHDCRPSWFVIASKGNSCF